MNINWRDDSRDYYSGTFSTNIKPYTLSFPFSLIQSCNNFNRKYIWNFHYLFFQFIAGSDTVTTDEHTLNGKVSGIILQIFHLKALTVDWKVTMDLMEQISVGNT